MASLLVQSKNPIFYERILPIMGLIAKTMKYDETVQKKEDYLWHSLNEELSICSSSLSKEELRKALNQCDKEKLEEYMKRRDSSPFTFFKEYPLLSFLLFSLSPKDIAVPFFLAYDQVQLIHKDYRVTLEDIRYVRNDHTLDWVLTQKSDILKDSKLEDIVPYPGPTLLALKTHFCKTGALMRKAMCKGTSETIQIIRSYSYVPFMPYHLKMAIANTNRDAVECILSSGEVDSSSIEENMVTKAVRSGDNEILKIILQDSHVNVWFDKPPLLMAAMANRKDMVNSLLQDARIQEGLKDAHMNHFIEEQLEKIINEEIKDMISNYLS